MEKVIYSKVSDERDIKYQVITEIILNDDNKIVRKKNCYDVGLEHIRRIKENENKLKKVLGENAYVTRANYREGCIEFEFISGTNLDQALFKVCKNNNFNEIIGLLQEYQELIMHMKTSDNFTLTEEFKRIFGDVSLPGDMELT